MAEHGPTSFPCETALVGGEVQIEQVQNFHQHVYRQNIVTIAQPTEAQPPNTLQKVSPVKIYDPTVAEPNQRGKVNLESLREIFLQDDVADCPVAIYAISGEFGSGKSSLLNYFLHLDQAERNESAVEELNDVPSYFVAGPGTQGVTKGIQIYPKPIFGQADINGNKEKVAIFLIDTEGSQENEAQQVDADIFTISSSLSSLHIANFSKQVTTTNLNEHAALRLFPQALRQNDFLQTKFIFLVRDWQRSAEFGSVGGRNYLRELQEKIAAFSSRHTRSVQETMTCWLLPHPRISETKTVFFDTARNLYDELFKKNVEIKRNHGELVTGREMYGFCERLNESWAAIDQTEIPNLFQRFISDKAKIVQKRLISNFKSDLKKDDCELLRNRNLQEYKAKVRKQFENECFSGTGTEHLEEFERKMEMVYQEVAGSFTAKLMKKCQKKFRDHWPQPNVDIQEETSVQLAINQIDVELKTFFKNKVPEIENIALYTDQIKYMLAFEAEDVRQRYRKLNLCVNQYNEIMENQYENLLTKEDLSYANKAANRESVKDLPSDEFYERHKTILRTILKTDFLKHEKPVNDALIKRCKHMYDERMDDNDPTKNIDEIISLHNDAMRDSWVHFKSHIPNKVFKVKCQKEIEAYFAEKTEFFHRAKEIIEDVNLKVDRLRTHLEKEWFYPEPIYEHLFDPRALKIRLEAKEGAQGEELKRFVDRQARHLLGVLRKKETKRRRRRRENANSKFVLCFALAVLCIALNWIYPDLPAYFSFYLPYSVLVNLIMFYVLWVVEPPR